MDKKQKDFLHRSLLRRSMDEQDRNLHRFPTSTTNDPTDLFTNDRYVVFDQNPLPIPTMTSRKRPRQDDYSIQEYQPQVRKFN